LRAWNPAFVRRGRAAVGAHALTARPGGVAAPYSSPAGPVALTSAFSAASSLSASHITVPPNF